MDQVSILRVIVASPGDVQAERNTLANVIEEINRGVARAHGLRLEVIRWEKDAYPGFHVDGPQGLLDPILRIEDSDIFIGIFWKRFGTPVRGAQSGTEHEFQLAYEAWKEQGSPHIMFYFNQKPYNPISMEEVEQWGQVLGFQQRFPPEGMWWRYKSRLEFERFAREHLTNFILDKAHEAGEDSDDDTKQGNIHLDEDTLDENQHVFYRCELEEGDKINIDLKSEAPLDLMIMDEGDYQTWQKTGDANTYYKYYEDRDRLHAFFTAPENDEYLIIVWNHSEDEVEIEVNISYAE
jgi:hypothetical protein